jgi:hypothetical protein
LKKTRITLIVAGLGLVFGLGLAVRPASAQTDSILKDISYRQDAGRLVVLLKVEGPFTHEIRQLTTPPRLVVDLTSVGRIEAPPYLQIDDQGVVDVRVGQFQSQIARVVFDLGDRNPIFSLNPVAGGLEITFRLEAEPPAKPKPPRPQEVKIAKERKLPPPPTEPGRDGFFVSLKAGAALPLSSQLEIEREFNIYGEAGTLTHTYDYPASLAFEANVGKYLTLGGTRLKAGVGLSIVPMSATGLFDASIPHPFEYNKPRSFAFELPDLKASMTNIFVFGLFSFVETETLGVWAGPVVGLTMGTYGTLDDFSFNEESPYASSDITLDEAVSIEESVTTLYFGASINIEYQFSRRLMAIADIRMAYANPLLTGIGNRLNMFHLQAAVGLQINL